MVDALTETGGRGGIRTHGGVKPHNGFRDRPIRPLWHPPATLCRVYSVCVPVRRGRRDQRGTRPVRSALKKSSISSVTSECSTPARTSTV
jgi:hypothetical protein